ncbi:MAG: hypothetical protein WBQ31_24780, partial [Candidatus Acidiferrales bacterium]
MEITSKVERRLRAYRGVGRVVRRVILDLAFAQAPGILLDQIRLTLLGKGLGRRNKNFSDQLVFRSRSGIIYVVF